MVERSKSTPRQSARVARPRWIAVAVFLAFAVLVPGIARGFEPFSPPRPELFPQPRFEAPDAAGDGDPAQVDVPEPATGLLFGFGLMMLGSWSRSRRVRMQRRSSLGWIQNSDGLAKAGEEAIGFQENRLGVPRHVQRLANQGARH